MRSRSSALLGILALSLLACLPACSLLHHKKPESAAAVAGRHPNARGLDVELKTAPDPLKLGEARQIDVTLILHNDGKRAASLKFPTSQVIEIVLRDPSDGKIVSQWSTDRSFDNDIHYVIVNPGERAQYNEPIATRDLHAGKTYTLEAYFMGHEKELHAARQITPLP